MERTDSASSDFKIICGNDTYDVHRFVISIHSGYFKRLCEGGFQDATERRVTLHDDPPFAVKLMVDWFYNFDYMASSAETWVLKVHSAMFTLADKYDIPKLKTLALARVQLFSAPSFPNNQLESRCLNMLFATLHAFKNAPPTDDCLCKALVVGWVVDDKRILRHTDKDDLEYAMTKVPEFASALVEELCGFTLMAKG